MQLLYQRFRLEFEKNCSAKNSAGISALTKFRGLIKSLTAIVAEDSCFSVNKYLELIDQIYCDYPDANCDVLMDYLEEREPLVRCCGKDDFIKLLTDLYFKTMYGKI